MLVKNHLRRNVHTVSDQGTFRDALETMIRHKTNGLLVVDAHNQPVGTIDSFNLIAAMVPAYLLDDPTLAQFASEGLFHKSLSQALSEKITDLMEPCNGIQVHEDDPLILAVVLATKNNARYIPVVNDDGELIGLVSRTDIKKAMGQLLQMDQEEK